MTLSFMSRDVVAQAILLIQAVFTMMYWVVYASTGSPFPERWYTAYEESFPRSDVINSVICVLHLRDSRRSLAMTHGLMAVGGQVFLGLLDISFNIENDMCDAPPHPRSAHVHAHISPCRSDRYSYVIHGTPVQQMNMLLEIVINIECTAVQVCCHSRCA